MNSARNWITRPEGRRRLIPILLCIIALSIIGAIDYLIGYRISLIVLYILPIGFATIYVGRAFAVILAVASVIIWMGGDLLAGAPYPGAAIQLWNGGIVLSLFVIVIVLLDALRRALVGLEATVQERTQALRREMQERQRLEHEILDVSEKERQHFGHELHDVVCQELASIAIASDLLTKKLRADVSDKAESAHEIAEMVDRALTKARSVARGFFTAGFDVAGLAESLRETAHNTEEQTGVRCDVQWQENLAISDKEVVIHFFRIAQEAILNATKHSKASHIQVSLNRRDRTVQLVIEDNGKGLTPSEKNGKGLGLRIMAYRASIIGGELNIQSPASGGLGTRVTCVVPTGIKARDINPVP
jgi:signal transduction histidine kinase